MTIEALPTPCSVATLACILVFFPLLHLFAPAAARAPSPGEN